VCHRYLSLWLRKDCVQEEEEEEDDEEERKKRSA
jgi:hypothetical protein